MLPTGLCWLTGATASREATGRRRACHRRRSERLGPGSATQRLGSRPSQHRRAQSWTPETETGAPRRLERRVEFKELRIDSALLAEYTLTLACNEIAVPSSLLLAFTLLSKSVTCSCCSSTPRYVVRFATTEPLKFAFASACRLKSTEPTKTEIEKVWSMALLCVTKLMLPEMFTIEPQRKLTENEARPPILSPLRASVSVPLQATDGMPEEKEESPPKKVTSEEHVGVLHGSKPTRERPGAHSGACAAETKFGMTMGSEDQKVSNAGVVRFWAEPTGSKNSRQQS
eukprot:110787-Rhodomonas_salina.4